MHLLENPVPMMAGLNMDNGQFYQQILRRVSTKAKENTFYWMVDADIIYFDINALSEIQVPLFDLDWARVRKAYQKRFSSSTSSFLSLSLSPSEPLSFSIRNLKKVGNKLKKLQREDFAKKLSEIKSLFKITPPDLSDTEGFF